ncbi:unnamed protein product [Polarella glacialis]|uniref:FAS1 domain-containing protein n=1 Tax=Polarella glacialis TaxID=89957 RepID=A0A813EEZ3_POLGL|nr:unnamed protein product [Polarella glacialis]CAE8738998.1 unnamed protein product [Polarella glacialis]
MALHSAPGNVFLAAGTASSALRGSTIAFPAVELPAAALAHASAASSSSASLVGLAAVGAAVVVASSLRRRGQTSGRAAVVACRAQVQSIAATAIANGNFKILVKALKKADLVETVSGKDPYTVFAPTDEAFKEVLKELGIKEKDLLDSKDLKDILLYHVLGGTTMSKSLKDNERLTTAQGSLLAIQIVAGTVKVGGKAVVEKADIACTNGVIHVIDRVLLPPPAPFVPKKEIGAMAPLGFFDPAGFTKANDEAGFFNYRAAEIKHGRVAMMAALGLVVQHYVQFPGFEAVPTGLAACTKAPGTYGFAALVLLSGLFEVAFWQEDESKEPGNFGDPLGLNMYNKDMREREINNGRMAMFSAIGIIAAETLTGKDGVAQLGLEGFQLPFP